MNQYETPGQRALSFCTLAMAVVILCVSKRTFYRLIDAGYIDAFTPTLGPGEAYAGRTRMYDLAQVREVAGRIARGELPDGRKRW